MQYKKTVLLTSCFYNFVTIKYLRSEIYGNWISFPNELLRQNSGYSILVQNRFLKMSKYLVPALINSSTHSRSVDRSQRVSKLAHLRFFYYVWLFTLRFVRPQRRQEVTSHLCWAHLASAPMARPACRPRSAHSAQLAAEPAMWQWRHSVWWRRRL